MTINRSKCPKCGGPTVVLSAGEHITAIQREHTETLLEAARLREETSALKAEILRLENAQRGETDAVAKLNGELGARIGRTFRGDDGVRS